MIFIESYSQRNVGVKRQISLGIAGGAAGQQYFLQLLRMVAGTR